MSVTDVTDADFGERVLRSEHPVLVEYWADWCGPCRQLAPIVGELAEAYGDRMRFVKMDTNRNQVTPATYFVQGLPTIHIFVSGELVKTFQGSKTKSMLTRAIEEYV
ncbi:thioredoxin domain-containing protein [Ammonicoccus fulvus]|uniref:Thioredoxin n=1 Tax=Ammonicoccus fulvus TaxID=3138240 RepID=A0ABZ3FVY8_9ACTN